MRHEIGTVPSLNWVFDVCSELPTVLVDEELAPVCFPNAEFVAFEELYPVVLALPGGTRRTKAVVGDGISSTSTCWPRLTARSPGQPGEFT